MASKKDSTKNSKPLAMLTLDLKDKFWDYLRANDVKTVFITATLNPPISDPRPSLSGAFYAILTALVGKEPAHLVQYVEPLLGIGEVDDIVDSEGTTEELSARMQQYRDTARHLGMSSEHGRWRAL